MYRIYDHLDIMDGVIQHADCIVHWAHWTCPLWAQTQLEVQLLHVDHSYRSTTHLASNTANPARTLSDDRGHDKGDNHILLVPHFFWVCQQKSGRYLVQTEQKVTFET